MAPIGSCSWMFGHQGEKLFERIKRFRRFGLVKRTVSFEFRKGLISLFQLMEQDVVLNYFSRTMPGNAPCHDDNELNL